MSKLRPRRRLRRLRSMWGLRLRSLLRSLRNLASAACVSSGQVTTCSSVFVVKDIESRQTNVRDFFLIESNCRVHGQSIVRRTNGCSERAARQRQRPSDYRYGFRPTLSLRISVAMRHGGEPVRLVAYRFDSFGSLALFEPVTRRVTFGLRIMGFGRGGSYSFGTWRLE